VLSKTDKWVALVAIVTVVVYIVAYSVFILPSPKPTLYGNITVGSYASYTVPNPTIKLSIDVNGDGVNEILKTYNPTTIHVGSEYLLSAGSQIFEYNIVLDSSATNWTFTVKVLNGLIPLHFDGNNDQSTYICNMSVTRSDQMANNTYLYAPPLDVPTNCRLRVEFGVLDMLTPVH